MAFEYVKGDTLFHKFDPRVKLLLAATIIIMAVGFTDPIWLIIVFSFLIFLILYCKLRPGEIAAFLKNLSPLAAMYFIFNLLFPMIKFEETTTLFTFLGFVVTLEALVWAIGALIRFITILVVIRIVLMLTPIRDIILSLVKFRLPPEFAIAMSIGLAYLPVLVDENRKIKEALMSKGWDYRFRNPIKRFRALFMQMLIPSILNSMRRTEDIALAITARGFGYNLRARTFLHEIKYTKKDYVASVILIIISALAIYIGWFTNLAEYTFTLTLLKSGVIQSIIQRIMELIPWI